MYSIEMRGITKKFGTFCANSNVDLLIKKGEIHALLGENGAGKTTLMNVLYGIYGADEGEIFVGGKKMTINSPRDAIANGIGMVHQHFMLVQNFTVAQNIVLGMKNRFWVKLEQVEKELDELSAKYKLKIDPRKKVSELSVGEQERVEIIKALYRKVDVLILDEPTAVLTPQEIDDLFVTLKDLKNAGISIIIITHKLDEVMAVTDTVTVLRHGINEGTISTAETNQKELAKLMVGHEVLLNIEKAESQVGDVVLSVDNVHAIADGVEKLKGISLEVRAGEVLGIAGVDGNGQRELARSIVGLLTKTSGTVTIGGKDVTRSTVKQILDEGVAYIPEDRIKDGLLCEFSIEDNLVLQSTNDYKNGPLISRKKIREHGIEMMKEFDIRAKDVTEPVKLLSGGNQQKIIFGRELTRKPRLLIATQPTRGLDIGAVEYMWTRIEEAKQQGVAVLLISTELDEILTLSDRIEVIYEGEIIGKFEGDDIHKLGLLMAGVKPEETNKTEEKVKEE